MVQKTRFAVSTFVEKFCEVTVRYLGMSEHFFFFFFWNYWGYLTYFSRRRRSSALGRTISSVSPSSNPAMTEGEAGLLAVVGMSTTLSLLWIATWFASSRLGFLLVVLNLRYFLVFKFVSRNVNHWFTSNCVKPMLLRRNPLGNWVILIFSGQKPCTRII